MVMNIAEMLKKMGWKDGFHVPIANAENKALEDEVMKLTLRRAKANTTYENAKGRFEALEKHLKFVNQESEQNQVLINAHKHQIETEQHRYRMNEGERDKYNQEIRQMAKTTAEVYNRAEQKKADLARGMAKMEKLKSEASWDAEALTAWEEALKKRDEDNELLAKFSREDERRVTELEAKRQQLSLEVVNRKALVAKMVAEVINYEQVLDRTGKIFAQQRIERRALVHRWQDAIRQLRHRDAAILHTQDSILTANATLSQVQDSLAEADLFTANERRSNAAVEEQTSELNALSSRLRSELSTLIDWVARLNNETGARSRLLATTGGELERERIRGRGIDENLENRREGIERVREELEELGKKREEVKNSSLSASDRAKRLELIVDNEKRKENILGSDTNRMQSVLYRSQQILRELVNEYLVIEAEMKGCEVATALLQRRAKLEKLELETQQTVVYEIEFRIERLSNQLAGLEGQVKDDKEKDIWMHRITELETELARHVDTRSVLQAQATRLQDEMRRLSVAIGFDSTQLEILRGKRADNILLHEGGLKMALAAKTRMQQRQVDENVIRLRVFQLNKAMTAEDNSIYGLRRLRIDLETALRERQIEIQANREVILVKKRNLEEEMGRLRADIAGRHIKLEQFQSKHHIALMSLGTDDDGEPLSVTHLKIRNAQEKYILQEKGDELDGRISRAEREIEAMENTLQIVNATNVKYRNSLAAVDEIGDEATTMKTLEKEKNETALKLRDVNKDLQSKQDHVIDLRNIIIELTEKYEECREVLVDLEEKRDHCEKDEQDRNEKIKRSSRHINTMKKSIPEQKLNKYDKDLHIRQLKDANKNALHQLSELAARHQEMTPLVTRYLEMYGGGAFQLHLGPRSRLSSTISSASVLSLPSTTSPSNSSTGRRSEGAASSVASVVLEFGGGGSGEGSKVGKGTGGGGGGGRVVKGNGGKKSKK